MQVVSCILSSRANFSSVKFLSFSSSTVKCIFKVYTSQMMTKCLECALIQCQLQLQSLLFLQLHQSTHQSKIQGANASSVEETVIHQERAHTCHLGGNNHRQVDSNDSSVCSMKDWSLLLSHMMMQNNNQHLVHHLLASLSSPRVNIINGDNSPSVCKKHATGSTGQQVSSASPSSPTAAAAAAAADNDVDDYEVQSGNLSHSPSINYLHSEGSIKSSSVKKLFPSPHRPDKDETKSHTSFAHSSPSSSSTLLLNDQIVSTAEKPFAHQSPVHEKMYHDDVSHLTYTDNPVNQSVSYNDLPDSINHETSSSSSSSSLSSSPSSSFLLKSRKLSEAKSIGADLRRIARSFHLSLQSNHSCIL